MSNTQPRVLNATRDKIRPGNLPSNAVYIGRATRNGWKQSKWHNPFRIGRDGTREEVLAKHRAYICDDPVLMAALPEIRGKDLVCWCAPEGCHGDLLLALANE
jgi:hypothetical protein